MSFRVVQALGVWKIWDTETQELLRVGPMAAVFLTLQSALDWIDGMQWRIDHPPPVAVLDGQQRLELVGTVWCSSCNTGYSFEEWPEARRGYDSCESCYVNPVCPAGCNHIHDEPSPAPRWACEYDPAEIRYSFCESCDSGWQPDNYEYSMCDDEVCCDDCLPVEEYVEECYDDDEGEEEPHETLCEQCHRQDPLTHYHPLTEEVVCSACSTADTALIRLAA